MDWTKGRVVMISPPIRARRLLAAFLGLAMIVGALASTADPAAAQPSSPDRYLVLTSSDAVDRPVAQAERLGGDVLHTFHHVTDGFSAELTPAQATQLEADPSVDEVIREKRYQMSAQGGAAATQPSPPWGLDRIDQRNLPLNSKYGYTNTGAGSTVFVIDSGIRLTHTQFQGRAVSGWDFVDSDANASDCFGHGTHVAGTIGANTYGVAKRARLVSVRVLDCGGDGWPSDVIAGLDWVVAHRPATGPAVINMSLGFEVDDETHGIAQELDTAVNATVAAGIPVVVAAGNSGQKGVSSCDFSPAQADQAITVGASDSNDVRANFSNLGGCVDLYAPGVDIPSASNEGNTEAELMSGTSMATPHVSGAVARMLQDNPLASPTWVTNELIARSTKGIIGGAQAAGTPNRLLYLAPPKVVAKPGKPGIKKASSGTKKSKGISVTARWKKPTSGGPVASYQVKADRLGSKKNKTVKVKAGVYQVKITGLAKNKKYKITVRAVNAGGTSAWSKKSKTVKAK